MNYGPYRYKNLWLACATLFAALCGCFAFATSLGAFVECATTGLGENTVLLHLAIKFLQRDLKGVARIYFHFAHECYQRDLRSEERPEGLTVW